MLDAQFWTTAFFVVVVILCGCGAIALLDWFSTPAPDWVVKVRRWINGPS